MHNGEVSFIRSRVQSPRHPPEMVAFGHHNTCRFTIFVASISLLILSLKPR